MGNYCLNDLPFSYCKGEPKRQDKEVESHVMPDYSNKNTGIIKKTIPACKLDPATCGLFISGKDMPGMPGNKPKKK